MKKNLEERIQELTTEKVVIVSYNPEWVILFNDENKYLSQKLPTSIVKRIEHFGSTAIVDMPSKPIIDMLIEVSSLEETKKVIVPILESDGYDYFWRPTIGDNPPYYVWFIKRNPEGHRTHHIHMVESDSELWDRIYFRDYLREFPVEAKKYRKLKEDLSNEYPNDRIAYTKGKIDYIVSVTQKAINYYKGQEHL